MCIRDRLCSYWIEAHQISTRVWCMSLLMCASALRYSTPFRNASALTSHNKTTCMTACPSIFSNDAGNWVTTWTQPLIVVPPLLYPVDTKSGAPKLSGCAAGGVLWHFVVCVCVSLQLLRHHAATINDRDGQHSSMQFISVLLRHLILPVNRLNALTRAALSIAKLL